MHTPPDEIEATRHLAELGYVDPFEAGAMEAAAKAGQESRLRAAEGHWKQGRHEEAAALLHELIDEAPSWIAPRKYLAEILVRRNRLTEAERQLDWLTFHGVESPRLSFLSGKIALARRDLAGAIDLLEYAAHAQPALAGVQVLLARAYSRGGKIVEAEGAVAAALERNPRDVQALSEMSALCLRTGDYESAAEWALEAIDEDPRVFMAHLRLGVALAELSRLDDARCALEVAARVDPSHPAPYYWLRRIARLGGDSRREEAYRRAGRDVVRRRRERRQRPASPLTSA